MFVNITLTFIEARCMYTILINQRIKRIKIFDCFDFFIYEEGTSYLNKGQWSTDEDDRSYGNHSISCFVSKPQCIKKSKDD